MKRALTAAVALLALVAPLQAQNEATLRAALEGKTLTVKVDMPATSKGIDVFPGQAMPVNWREMADRMKDNGTALKIGESVMITKVVVKGDSHIELQLGGGGYGTFGDYMSNSSSVSAVSEGESTLERALRDSIKVTPNGAKKKQFERQLSSERTKRERDNAKAKAEAAQANEAREANMRVKRAEAGSRFNIRYDNGITADALTPEGVMRALAQYADFGALAPKVVAAPLAAPVAAAPVAAPPAMAPGFAKSATIPAGAGILALKKGLTIAEVESLLGPANTASAVDEGGLAIVKRNYLYDGKKVSTTFVNGVLIDYAIAPG